MIEALQAAAEQALAVLDRIELDKLEPVDRSDTATWEYWSTDSPDTLDAVTTALRAALAAEQPQPRTTEQHCALREAHEIAAEHDYFNARPYIPNDGLATMLFEAGFRRGFDAGAEVYAAPPPPAAAPAEQPQPVATLHVDGYWTHPRGRDPLDRFKSQGRSRMDVYAAPPPPAAAPTDAITDAVMTLVGEKFKARAFMSRDELRDAINAALSAQEGQR